MAAALGGSRAGAEERRAASDRSGLDFLLVAGGAKRHSSSSSSLKSGREGREPREEEVEG